MAKYVTDARQQAVRAEIRSELEKQILAGAEKALKALLLKKGHKLIKTHDLVLLSRKLSAPEDIVQICKELTPVYVETRYPDLGETGFKEFTSKEAKEDIKKMNKITKWAKKNL